MTGALAVFLALAAYHGRGFWGYWLASPGVIDIQSVRLIFFYAVLPILGSCSLWAASYDLGRRAAGAKIDVVSASALGLGLIASMMFVLGLVGLYDVRVFILIAAVLVSFLRRPKPFKVTHAAAGLFAYALFSAASTAAAPATAWDARAYHLAIPELSLAAGRLVLPPWMLHAHWPHLMEALYVLPLGLGSEGGAAFIHLGAACLLVYGVFLAGGWTAALILAVQPVLLREAGTAHSDAASALFAWACASTLARVKDDRGLVAAGLLAGFCAASKMTGLAMVAGGVLHLARRDRRSALIFACAAAAAVGPWLIRTWILAGSPFWPFDSWNAAAAALAERTMRSNRWDRPTVELLLHDGPLFLLLPAALALLMPKRAPMSSVEKVLWSAAPFYLMLTWRQNEVWRFLMPLWPALALWAARTPLVIASLPLLFIGPNNALFGALAPRPRTAPDADRRALYAERAVDVLAFYREARGVLPPGAKVLLWREIRGYGAGFDYLWGDPMNQALIEYRRLPDPDALYLRLKELGVTHVLDHPASTLYREDPGYYDRRTLALMAAALSRHARPVLTREGLVLHQLL